MKEIGNIYLSWRKSQGERRHIVGVIKRNATDGIRFSYFQDKVEIARKDGFTVYTEFPDVTQEYSQGVMDVFGQRIMKSERADIAEFLDFWEIDPKYKDDKYYLLAHTQGLNPTDNFEFLVDYYPVRNLRFLTDLAGLSILKHQIGTIAIGDQLTYQLEPDNAYDKRAVKVLKEGKKLGYIKKVHSRVFHKMNGKKLHLRVKAMEHNGIIKRVFVTVHT